MQVQSQAIISDALSNQPGNPIAVLWGSELLSPCTENPCVDESNWSACVCATRNQQADYVCVEHRLSRTPLAH